MVDAVYLSNSLNPLEDLVACLPASTCLKSTKTDDLGNKSRLEKFFEEDMKAPHPQSTVGNMIAVYDAKYDVHGMIDRAEALNIFGSRRSSTIANPITSCFHTFATAKGFGKVKISLSSSLIQGRTFSIGSKDLLDPCERHDILLRPSWLPQGVFVPFASAYPGAHQVVSHLSGECIFVAVPRTDLNSRIMDKWFDQVIDKVSLFSHILRSDMEGIMIGILKKPTIFMLDPFSYTATLVIKDTVQLSGPLYFQDTAGETMFQLQKRAERYSRVGTMGESSDMWLHEMNMGLEGLWSALNAEEEVCDPNIKHCYENTKASLMEMS